MVPDDLRTKLRGLVTGKLPWPLFLFGKHGVGKSSVGKLLQASVGGAIFRQCSMYENIAFTDGGLDWEQANETPLVIVDEVGAKTKHASEYSYASMKRLLDLRETKHNRTGVYISNLDSGEIATFYDDRIASRMLCGTVHLYGGADMRVPTDRRGKSK